MMLFMGLYHRRPCYSQIMNHKKRNFSQKTSLFVSSMNDTKQKEKNAQENKMVMA